MASDITRSVLVCANTDGFRNGTHTDDTANKTCSETGVFNNQTHMPLEPDYDPMIDLNCSDYYFNDTHVINWEELAPPLVVYIVTYLVGVVGNFLIIFTISNFPRLKSTTNLFLASLASADLILILICIPVKLARLFSYTWTFGEVLCKIVYYLQSLTAICSVLTLSAMSIERYYAIVYPMRAQYRCTLSQARRLCLIVWVLSIVLATPILFVQVHMEVGMCGNWYWCVRNFDSTVMWPAYETYMLILVLVVPAFIMAAAYAAICSAVFSMMVLRQSMTEHTTNGLTLLNVSCRKSSDEEKAEARQVVAMLVVVVVLFIICWGPILVINVLKSYGILPAYSPALKHVVTAADLLSYCNSCINPIVYGFMSRNFREGFWQSICCKKSRRRSSLTRQISLSLTRVSVLRQHDSSPSGSINFNGCPNGDGTSISIIKTTPS